MRIISVVALLIALTAVVHGQPTGGTLGTVRLPQPVMVDGTTLPAGSYQLRVRGGTDAPMIEFVQNGQVRATTMAIVPSDHKAPAGTRAQRVRNDDDPYVRVSINRGGQHYLAYLPATR
jgi:hypothetical protein